MQNAPSEPAGDDLAVQRYRYLLRTAPPDRIEAAHEEAFSRLSPEHRRRVLEALASEVDPREARAADDSPHGLARLATRAEVREPGTIERALGPQGAGGGGFLGGGFLSMLAGAFLGTTIANAFFPPDLGGAAGASDAEDPGATDAGGWDDGSAGADSGDLGDTGGFGDGGLDLGDIGF